MSTVKLNIREYKDKTSNKLVKVRWRIKNNSFDKSYQCNDIVATIADLCKFDSNLNHGRTFNQSLLIALHKRQGDIISIMNESDWTDYELLKTELDKLCTKITTHSPAIKDMMYYFQK